MKPLGRLCPECGAPPHEHCRGVRAVCWNVKFTMRKGATSWGVAAFHDARIHEGDYDQDDPETAWSVN